MSEGGNSSQQSAAVLLEDELEKYCDSDSLSERGLRELIAQHGLTPGNQNRLSNYDFFDVVFYNIRVTEGIIQLLLEYFPGAISDFTNFEDDELSPLYYACGEACNKRNATLSFIKLIVDADPVSVRCVNFDGRTPLHQLCGNEQVDEATALEILNFLIEMYPEAARHADNGGCLPIHLACMSRSGEFCQVLINEAPDSVRSVANDGSTPLHCSFYHRYLRDDDEASAMQVLKLLIDKYQEAARHADVEGSLPIHLASRLSSREYVTMLVKAYPESVSVPNANGELPLHYACSLGSLATVEYLYHQYPDAIDYATTSGFYLGHYPIHAAICRSRSRYNSATALEVVQFLLNCDPNQKLIQLQGKSLLHYACDKMRYSSNVEAGIQLIKVLFDAHPEAIEDNGITSNIHRFHQKVQAFINDELVYARQANDHRLMTTADYNGQLPLHTALQNNVTLGSIKLLVKGNPSAIWNVDTNSAFPLHIACQHHDSASVVQYLLEVNMRILRFVDIDNNTALHYACLGAKHDTISMLLEKYDTASVSKRNAQDKLPIDLLWESNEGSDRKSLEYTESVFRLIRANPEMFNQ